MNANEQSEMWLNDFIQKLSSDKTDNGMQQTVYDYLKETYPEDTLQWVKGSTTWELNDAVPLDDIKMARRPGGPREMDKVKNIAKAIEDGEEMEPVVLVELPDGTKKIADGYHRTLGHKHADVDTVKAWVGKVQEDKGPWDKEMHEKKLNKGTNQKTAFEVEELELSKTAAPVLGLVKRFAGGVTGVSKKKATNSLNNAVKEQNTHAETMKNFQKVNDNLKDTKNMSLNERYDVTKAQSRMQEKTNKLQANVSSAEKNLSQAKRDQFLSRGTAAVGATGLLAANSFNKNLKENEIQPISNPVVQPLTNNQLPKIANRESFGLAKLAHKK